MNTKQQLALAWTVAAILAVLLIVTSYLLMHPKKDLGTVLGDGTQDIAAQRDQIRADCNGTDQASKDRCAADLQDLNDLLQEFREELAKTAPQAPVAP